MKHERCKTAEDCWERKAFDRGAYHWHYNIRYKTENKLLPSQIYVYLISMQQMTSESYAYLSHKKFNEGQRSERYSISKTCVPSINNQSTLTQIAS